MHRELFVERRHQKEDALLSILESGTALALGIEHEEALLRVAVEDLGDVEHEHVPKVVHVRVVAATASVVEQIRAINPRAQDDIGIGEELFDRDLIA